MKMIPSLFCLLVFFVFFAIDSSSVYSQSPALTETKVDVHHVSAADCWSKFTKHLSDCDKAKTTEVRWVCAIVAGVEWFGCKDK